MDRNFEEAKESEKKRAADMSIFYKQELAKYKEAKQNRQEALSTAGIDRATTARLSSSVTDDYDQTEAQSEAGGGVHAKLEPRADAEAGAAEAEKDDIVKKKIREKRKELNAKE
eukprot:CAMPEP_0170473688 /NCGR_PEP_ID=MMETSP0123-20130129/15569_1 /TAXON_ID=182087 /ORGANISM="Favella ehrenbergii, Strain Fehren 1" /LENGTH=113 /DNA_ID=CAMNT_0010742909 /DNA_START=1486 /DNA_END=1830 /DNA_ORIENTATION=-